MMKLNDGLRKSHKYKIELSQLYRLCVYLSVFSSTLQTPKRANDSFVRLIFIISLMGYTDYVLKLKGIMNKGIQALLINKQRVVTDQKISNYKKPITELEWTQEEGQGTFLLLFRQDLNAFCKVLQIKKLPTSLAIRKPCFPLEFITLASRALLPFTVVCKIIDI